MIKKTILYIIFIFTSIAVANAQGISFTASTKNTVGVGEQFKVVYTVNAQGSAFKAPAFKNFEVLSGPNQSSSSSVQIVNGAMTQSVSFSFTYYLQATKEGTFNFSPAIITINGKTYQSNSIAIKVVKGSPAAAQNNSRNNNGNQGTQQTTIAGSDIFARTTVSKNKVYQGDQLVITHKIYTKLNLVGFENYKFPSYSGFWTEDIKLPAQISLHPENLDGVNYQVGEIKKLILFPQHSGTLTIDPVEMECVVRIATRNNDFWGSFFGGGVQNKSVKVKSPEVKINVLSLPTTSQPIDFKNAVGKFTFKPEISSLKTKTNEAVTLKFTISGSGNLRLIDKLDIDFPPDIESYDPKTNDNISVSANGVSGSRTFEYLLIPRNAGDFKIKPVTFSYFDTEKKSYVSFSSPEYTLHVEKGKDGGSTSTISSVNKEDVKYIGSDIRFIKTKNAVLKERGDLFFFSPLFLVMGISPLLLFGLFIFLWRKRIKQNSNAMLVKHRKATKVARKRLKLANVFLQQKDKNKLYDELFKALWGYMADKLSIPVSDLSKESLQAQLNKKNIDQSLIDEFVETLNLCEFARFAPSSETTVMENLYNKVVEAISKMEQKLR